MTTAVDTPHEMMAVAAARAMGRGTVFLGISHPMLAGCLAKLHHEPDLIFGTAPAARFLRRLEQPLASPAGWME